MLRVGDENYATLAFTLSWSHGDLSCEERFHAPKAAPVRDIFPPGLREGLLGLEPGQSVSLDYPEGLVPPPSPENVVTVPLAALDRLVLGGRRLTPRLGRFYPRGLVRGLPGVFGTCDMRPARVVGLSGDEARLDLNHPLAGRPVRLAARVEDLWPTGDKTAGTIRCWAEMLTDNGPGLQAPLPHAATDFVGPGDLDRPDPAPDPLFYTEPRLVSHLDAEALAVLRGLYAERLSPGLRVLDLMASADSHLPEGLPLAVLGLGLNAAELAANPALIDAPDGRMVQDLNAAPVLPWPDASFDVVLISLSVEYLADPRAVLAEAGRVLAPGGRLLVSFSNRWFPSKAVRLWTELHEFERQGFVLGVLRETGLFGGYRAVSDRNRFRPREDRYFPRILTCDPVYLVEAVRV